MGKFGIGLIILGLFVAGSPLSLAASGQKTLATEPGKLTLRVFNYAQVSPLMLGHAQREASRVFTASGIETAWVECVTNPPDPAVQAICRKPFSPERMIIRIVKQVTSSPGFTQKALGFAFGDAAASVIYDRIKRTVWEEDLFSKDLPSFLGDAMAHEIGHLLLGSNSHSPVGIMRGRWLREDILRIAMGQLHFTDEQSIALRAEVLRRNSSPTLAAEESGDEQSPDRLKADRPGNDAESSAGLESGLL